MLTIDFAKLWAGQRGESSPVRLVGVRGVVTPADANVYEQYNDRIFVLIDGADPVEWTASTEPSWPLVRHPINPDGAAQLCEGNHLFELHLMHGRYLCLGQAENVHINRLNTDGTIKAARIAGQWGICIHSGGAGMDTGRFSAGCQIIANPDGYFEDPTWTRFFGPIHAAMRAHGLAAVPYLLTTTDALQSAGLI